MSVAVVLAFEFCWFLMHLNMFLIDLSDVFETCGIPIWPLITGFLLGHSNSAINCCIYPIFSQEYRRGFKQSLKSLFSKHARSTPQNNHKPRAADIPLEGQMANWVMSAPAEWSSFKCNRKLSNFLHFPFHQTFLSYYRTSIFSVYELMFNESVEKTSLIFSLLS